MDQVNIRKRLINGLLLGFLVFVFILIINSFVLAFEWLKTPFLGRFLEPSMLVNSAPIYNQHENDAYPEIEYRKWFQLIEINHQRVDVGKSYNELLSSDPLSKPVAIRFRDQEGTNFDYSVMLYRLPFVNQILYFYLPFIIGWTYFISSLILLKDQLLNGQKSGYLIFFGATAIVLCSFFDLITSHQIYPIWIAAFVFSSAGLFHIAIQEVFKSRYFNSVIGFGYFLAFVTAFFTWIKPYGIDSPIQFLSYIYWALLFFECVFFTSFFVMIFAILKNGLPNERKRFLILFGISILSFGPILVWIFLYLFGLTFSFNNWLLIPLFIFPITICISNKKFVKFSTDKFQTEMTKSRILVVITTLGYGFLVSGVGLIILNKMKLNSPFLSGFLIFLFAISIYPLKSYLEKKVSINSEKFEKRFVSRLNSFGTDLKGLSKLDDLVNLLRLDIQESVEAQYVHVFLIDSISNLYRATKFGNGKSSDLVFAQDSSLVKDLSRESKVKYLKEIESIPTLLKTELAQIKLLGAKLFVPIHGQRNLLGWVAMSYRLDGEPYSSNEIRYLSAIVDQTSLAIERSLVIDSLERRNTESSVLARVAQGVNYTVALNDIYEFIYTQISQIHNPEVFSIVLKGIDLNSLQQVFFVENSERMKEKENFIIDPKNSIEGKVISQGRPYFVENYTYNCKVNGYFEIRENLTSALLIPLNTGAETIGLLFLGQLTNQLRFSEDQIIFLQSLADQIAGAIVRAKILQESEHRAGQLSKLNDLTQKLTATLSLQPLYQNILSISTEIINCKQGVLYLSDPVTKEMGIQAVFGDIDKEKVEKRQPQGLEQSEREYLNGLPDIPRDRDANHLDVINHKNLENKIDSILKVPLISKNEVIGAIELRNRLDEQPFTRNDQEILTAFAAQASISIENAILYSNTDQALTNKVEELSIMQRIDRELNTTLDLQRVLDITLHWAIRQSKALAGIIGTVQPEGLHIDVFEGYEASKLSGYLNTDLPPSFLGINSIFDDGQPRQKILAAGDIHFDDLAKLQVLIPVRRKELALAFLFLEFDNAELLSDQILDFLVRLSDHASIALVNGQLYSEVRSANVAKSEFVSLVAHELKNPMTSIKGYTELLASGAVGLVNEAQSNFLTTIRSNVDRMNTLVSDLNDLTKIEAGRMRLEFRPVNLFEVVDEVVQSNRRLFEEKQQELHVLIPEQLPKIWADPTRLSQALINLVSNANKYSEIGSKITISAGVDRLENNGGVEMDAIHLWVEDNGIGIQDNDQSKIFQKFFRSEDPKTREVSGTGLGLNITKSLVELQGGRIWFESEFRKGSVFHILMPISNER